MPRARRRHLLNICVSGDFLDSSVSVHSPWRGTFAFSNCGMERLLCGGLSIALRAHRLGPSLSLTFSTDFSCAYEIDREPFQGPHRSSSLPCSLATNGVLLGELNSPDSR